LLHLVGDLFELNLKVKFQSLVSKALLYVVSVVIMVTPSQPQHMSSMMEMELLAMVQVMALLLFE
jgi:hypothetical protein